MSKSRERRLSVQWKAKAEKLEADFTAAAEQLAGMREALEKVEWIRIRLHRDGTSVRKCPWCNNSRARGHASDCQGQQALSAAPKRGRVVLHERVDLMDYAPSHETFMYGAGPGSPDCKSGEYVGAIRKRLLDNPQVGVVVEGFTVTVREEAE